MQKVVIDSDIIIDHFRIRSDIFDQLTQGIDQNTIKVYLPAVVYTEINSGQDSKNNLKLTKIEDLLDSFEFTLADKQISQRAGFLLRDIKNLKLADAIVAATTLSLKAKLATRNKKDFADIKDLKFFRVLK